MLAPELAIGPRETREEDMYREATRIRCAPRTNNTQGEVWITRQAMRLQEMWKNWMPNSNNMT